MTRSILRGKRFVEKVLDTGKKGDPLRCANPQEKRKRSPPGSTFLPESAWSHPFHAQILSGPVGTSPSWLIYLPDPFCHIPFFGKAKVRNLEISRPCSRFNPKFRISGRPILILNSRLKANQKMVTAAGSMGSKSKPTTVYSVQLLFPFSPGNQKWKTLRI